MVGGQELGNLGFHLRARSVPARLVRYERRMISEGDNSVVWRNFAVVTFLDATGGSIVAEDREPWEGTLLLYGDELTAYYDPQNPRQVQTRLPSRNDYLLWVVLVVVFPGGLSAAGALLLLFFR
jgi:hypothetical protein